MKKNSPHSVTRIRTRDLERLQDRAALRHRTPPEEIEAILDLVEILEGEHGPMDTLSHPDDGEVVPVIYRVTSKKGGEK